MTTITSRPAHPGSMKARIRALEASLNEVSDEAPALGYIASWNITPGTLVEHERLVSELRRNHMERFAPLPIRPKTAMRRALREMDKDHLVRLMQDTRDYTVYALVDEQVESDEGMLPEFVYNTDLRMVWYKAEGNDPDDALAFDDEAMGERFRPVVAKYMEQHTSGDISQMLLRIVRESRGVSMRSGGGVYFVPQGFEHLLLAGRLLIDDLAESGVLGQDTYMSVFSMPDIEAHKNDMRMHVAQDLRADLKRLEDDIREKEETQRNAQTKLQSGEVTRATGVSIETIQKYVGVADALEAKTLLYVDLLRMNADDLTGRLESMRQRLRRLAYSDEAPF